MELILASVMEIVQNAWPAALLALGLGLVFAVILLIASIKLKVTVDPKVEEVHKALPNLDCGACGFAGWLAGNSTRTDSPAHPITPSAINMQNTSINLKYF